MKSAAHEEPHLLVLEDIHWIDPLSHDLLESLARVCENLPVCILVTYRPPEATRLQKKRVEALAHFIPLELAPLNEAETEQMIRTKLVQLYPEQFTTLPKSLVAILTSRAEGNPFYIEELLNFLHDRGLNPYTIHNTQSFDLPSSLHSLILSRIDQLTEAQKITLKVASIIGRLFQVSWLDGYYPFLNQDAQLKTNLAELARINLTVLEMPEPELTYFFRHVLTRDVVYESLAYATRVQLHEQLAQFIETLGEERFLDLIAYHYGLTENIHKQKEYFQKAGDGFLIGIIGTANVLWLDAASFFISAGIVWLLIPRFQVQAKHESTSGKYLEELKDGLRFIARDHLILALVVMIMLTNFLDAIFSGVLQPVYVNEVYCSALNLGLLIAANGGGAVIGGLIYAAIGHRLPRHAIFVSAFMLTSFRFWVYAVYPPILILVVTTLIASIGAGPLNPIIGAVEFERIPANMRGRVFGAVTAGAWVAMPVGMLLGGILTENLGTFVMLVGLGIAYFITTLSMAFIPAMKEMNRKLQPSS